MSVQSDNNLQIIETADGSNTIFNAQVGENYHSKHGALQESRHVFVNSGLGYFLQKSKENSERVAVSILEVGFGTGLNFLLSADYCNNHEILLDYCGVEAFPLTLDMISKTGYDKYVSQPIWDGFLTCYKNALLTSSQISSGCKLQIANSQLLEYQSDKQYDLIYFDAFAAAHQPEMWDETAIAHTIRFLKPGGVFVTYAITGNLKRTLKALGCSIEKAKGAPGKREMLRAIKLV